MFKDKLEIYMAGIYANMRNVKGVTIPNSSLSVVQQDFITSLVTFCSSLKCFIWTRLHVSLELLKSRYQALVTFSFSTLMKPNLYIF